MVLSSSTKEGVIQAVVGLGQDVLEVVVLALDGPHGIVDGLADIRSFGHFEKILEAGGLGKV